MKDFKINKYGMYVSKVQRARKIHDEFVDICAKCGLHDKPRHPRRKNMCMDCGRQYEREAKRRSRNGKDL